MRVRSLAAPLATTLGVLGRDGVARVEGEAALASFQALGAAGEAARADAFLEGLRGAGRARPNIVLILTDDMRADELRLMPNVRRLLVRNGTTYLA